MTNITGRLEWSSNYTAQSFGIQCCMANVFMRISKREWEKNFGIFSMQMTKLHFEINREREKRTVDDAEKIAILFNKRDNSE